MAISAKMVQELRKSTGSPMMDCKKALTEADGDIDKAITILRERGQAKAAKRAGNETNEGRIFCKVSDDNKSVAIVEMTCETEPVSKNSMFLDFGEKIAGLVFDGKEEEVKSDAINEELVEIRAKLGENITIRNYSRKEGDLATYYIHSNQKIGVALTVNCEKAEDEQVKELSKNLTLQIASLAPRSVGVEDLDPAFVKEETEILKNQLKEDPKNQNKPDEILDRIVEGRKAKIFSEVCLLEQEYVKEKMKVSELIESVEKAVGSKIEIKEFIRYAIGS